jgi:hypothetical protein
MLKLCSFVGRARVWQTCMSTCLPEPPQLHRNHTLVFVSCCYAAMLQLASRVDSTVPGSRKGVVQKASMTGTLGSRWYVTMRCSSARLASSRGSVSPAVGPQLSERQRVHVFMCLPGAWPC